MNTYECKEKVLEYYDAKISSDYDNFPCVLDISTEDGYNFYAIQYDYNNNEREYYYNEDALYESVIDIIREGGSVSGVDDGNIEWEELYEEVAEVELSEKNKETRKEVLALLKPIAKTLLEDKIFTEEYSKLIDTEQQNDYVNLLLKELKFDTSC